MIKVALTGNIGSGKSTVAQMFKVFGVPVFKADDVARELYSEDIVKAKLISEFTSRIETTDGEIDKKELASIIFSDKKSLEKIISIVHPLVFEKYNDWCDSHKNESYTIHEAAIVFENNLQNNFDVIINVSATEDVRINRVIERDGITEDLVRKRMANQLSDEVKCRLSHFVVYNNGDSFLIPQVNKIHNKLLRL